MSRKKRRPSRQNPPATPRRLIEEMEQASSLVTLRRWPQARDLLKSLHERYPDRVDALTDLANVYRELKDTRRYQQMLERLIRLRPNHPDFLLALAGAYATNTRPVLAIRTFRRFLERWPDHERAVEVRQRVSTLEPVMEGLVADTGLTGEDRYDLAAMHEQAQIYLEQGSYEESRRMEEELLRRRPEFTPALNNLSLLHLIQGDLESAIAVSQRVLAINPQNFHALANLVHYLVLSGRVDEAREWAERLKAIRSTAVDLGSKKAEALSYLGDDEGVMAAFHEAKQAGNLDPPLTDPGLYHLAAVAALRLGREEEARGYWNETLKLQPTYDLVREILEDLRRPVGDRHAPWAFPFQNWVTPQIVSDLGSQLGPAIQRGGEEAVAPATRRFLSRHPEIIGLIPLWLDHGDPKARELALLLAKNSHMTGLLEALRDFALGQRGPDRMRHEAARIASEASLIPLGHTRMWWGGKWREVTLLGYEVHDEPIRKLSPQVEPLLAEALNWLREGEPIEAEIRLLQALELEPDEPSLLNNLATAYQEQGRTEEADALVRRIAEQHPEDMFGQLSLVRLLVREGELDQAEARLQPVLAQKRFHTALFAALCSAQIELLLARDRREAALSWFDMWEGLDPDHSAVQYWRSRLRPPVGKRKLFGR